jgi:LysR family transcriptional regulator for metE and metH
LNTKLIHILCTLARYLKSFIAMIEIRHLKTLLALRETGSLVEAAERLFLTQSALSHQLKELEARVECELFIRKSRPLRFTEAGKRLLLLAEEVLAKVSDAERDVKKLVHGEAGRLYMAIECHSCFNWLMPTIDVYRNQWPAIELDFSGGFTFEPLPALAQGEIDLVITSDPQEIRGIQYVPLFGYEMQIALANHHPLAQKDFLLPQDLAEQTLICYPVNRNRLDVFTRFLTPAAIEPAAVRTSELTLMMVQLVASGRGVCALPNWVAAEYVAQGLISVRSAGKTGIWPTLYAAVRDEYLALPYVQEFLALAKGHCLKNLSGVQAI